MCPNGALLEKGDRRGTGSHGAWIAGASGVTTAEVLWSVLRAASGCRGILDFFACNLAEVLLDDFAVVGRKLLAQGL